MKEMKVKWKVERLFNADPNKVALEIGQGKITPQEVLDRARDENSELHKCFEWDDSIAAEKYRLQQARTILINLVYEKEDKTAQPTRCYQITSECRTYQPVTKFLVQEDEYQQLLARAKRELESFYQRYKNLTELEQIFDEIRKL